jgi:plasmid maintenance system antidote protein VapI
MEGYQIAPQKFAESLGLTSAKLERLFDGSLPITGRRAHRLEQVDAARRTLIES